MEKKKKKKFSFQGYFKKSTPSSSNEERDNQNDYVDGDHVGGDDTIERDESEVEFSSHVRTQFCRTPLGLVAYYRCTEGKHATLEDSSGCNRPASIRNYRESGADSPWMFKLKNKELVDLENKRGKKAKANYCLKLSGKSKGYLQVESDNCLELLGGNYCTNERAIRIKKEISKKLGNENNEGFTFEMNEKFRFDSFPLGHLKTRKINDYYWTHVSIIFNLTIDLIYVILTGEESYFLHMCKNRYAIFYCSVFYPTNFFTDSEMPFPLYVGAKPYPEFGGSDGSDDMEGEDNPLPKQMNSEKRKSSSKSSRSHKGSIDFVSFLVTEIRLFALSRSADLVVKESKTLLECAWLDGANDELSDGREEPDEALNGLAHHTRRGVRSSLRDGEDPDSSKKNSRRGTSGRGKSSDNHWGILNSDDGVEYDAALSSSVKRKGGADEGDEIKNKCNEFNNEIEKMKKRFHKFTDEMKAGSAGGSGVESYGGRGDRSCDESYDRRDAGNANGAAAPSLRPCGEHPSQGDFFKFDSEEEQNDSTKDHFFSKPERKNNPYGIVPSSDDLFAKKRKSVTNKEKGEEHHSNKFSHLNTTRKKADSAFYFNFSDEGGEKREEEGQSDANRLDAPEGSEEDQTEEAKKPSWDGEAPWGGKHTPSGKRDSHAHSVYRKGSQDGVKSPMKKYLNKIVKEKNGDEPTSDSDYKKEDVKLLLNELKDKFESEFVDIMIDKLGHKFHLKRKDKEKIFSTFRSNGRREKEEVNSKEEADSEEVNSECIKERYLAMVKRKEDRRQNELHEEIKEELKKAKEQSTVERNLNNYIKDNQLLNEYYIKKYSYAGEKLSDKESEENVPQERWTGGKNLPDPDESEGPLSNSNSAREDESSNASERSHSIVNLQYQDGSHVFADGEQWSRSGIGEELNTRMGGNMNADFNTGEGHPRERVEQEEKKSDISDFTFMKRSSSGRGGRSERGGRGRPLLHSGESAIQGKEPPSLPSELRMVPSNETDLLPDEGEKKKSISNLLLTQEEEKHGDNQPNQAIRTGKNYYQFICPLTPYELFLLKRFHNKGINEELKEFRNKKYHSCEKQLMSTGGICRTPLNVAYIKYKITMMKSMLRSSRRYIHEKKFKKGLKVCIKNGEYIRNFVSSYCVLRRRELNRDSPPRTAARTSTGSSLPPSLGPSGRSPGEEQPPYQYADFYLNVDNAYITMDELKNIVKTNVRNVIICKLFILIKEYKKYKYIENSSLILVLQSVLCRIVTSYTLLRKILKKFILLLFLRGCLSFVESMCSFLFLLYPKERSHPLVSKVYSLCRNSFLIYSTCYKSNKYALINNYDLNFEQCVKLFSPEWGYYIYTTSNFNIFSCTVKFNGFLKRGADFSALREQEPQGEGQQEEGQEEEGQEERKTICDMGTFAGSGFDVGDPSGDVGPSADRTQLPEEDDPPKEPTDECKLATVNVCGEVCREEPSTNRTERKKNDLYRYLTNYEKKKRSYYIIDDNMRRIEFTRKETNHNLETFLQMDNPNESSSEQSKREQFDRLMSKVNRDVYLNSSGSCTNATFLGHCPHCKHAFNFFTRSCRVCQRYVHVCYYLLIHCTYKYHCELCDATYSEKCLEKFSKGFTCFYCGLFFIRK
ncbi:hypothetical protein C922_03280 [Plasmodium inui San Antonio 1]|uniref:Uncharacterized protein n=1 Tax=Plasmodium inui San Antonio 1 TaxID=1237626 RepID=W7ABA5_9APIC|nr:hypothetical protein C922_03280 [Plasmodium inui San Antonio 1]EUD66364.1 hypothetical protein C922_03280 [Plasmodium inui San Antonio 1]